MYPPQTIERAAGETLAAGIAGLQTKLADPADTDFGGGTNYVFDLKDWAATEYLAANTEGVLSGPPDKSRIAITFRNSGAAPRTITYKKTGGTYQAADTGALFTVNGQVQLILEGNITLDGLQAANDGIDNTGSLIRVKGQGILEIKDGVTLSGNTKPAITANFKTTLDSFAVTLERFAIFRMSGGTITGNTGASAVSIDLSAAFTMTGGSIKDNNGRAVYILCLNNTGADSTDTTDHITGTTTEPDSGIFIMNGGAITGNSTNGDGGAVYINWRSSFYMSGGEISGNTAAERGGAVFINEYSLLTSEEEIQKYRLTASFAMQGGSITGNTATLSGEDVYIPAISTFTMQGDSRVGRISLNSRYMRSALISACVTLGGDFIGAGNIAVIDLVNQTDGTNYWLSGINGEYPAVLRLGGTYTGLNGMGIMPAARFVPGSRKTFNAGGTVSTTPLTGYEIDNSTGLLVTIVP